MAPMGGRAELVRRAYGAGKPGLNLDNIRSLPIPLSPLAEQQHIIARVNELMSLCDCLEAQISSARSDSRRLLEAVLHQELAFRAATSPIAGPDMPRSNRLPSPLGPAVITG
jgi:type I restriction enzyme S subunit